MVCKHLPYSLIHLLLCVLKQHVFISHLIESNCAGLGTKWGSIQIAFKFHSIILCDLNILVHCYKIRIKFLDPSKRSMPRWLLSWKFWYALLKYFHVRKIRYEFAERGTMTWKKRRRGTNFFLMEGWTHVETGFVRNATNRNDIFLSHTM